MKSAGNVIIVDDEKILRKAYKNELKQKGYQVEAYDSAEEAIRQINHEWHGVIVSDIVMSGMDGLALLERVKEIDPELPIILITGHGDIPMAVKAMRNGAYDFLEKPFDTSYFLDVVKRATEKRDLVMEVRKLRSQLEGPLNLENKILGKSPAIKKLRHIIESVADCEVDILINGETGTGKDLVARCLHEESHRRKSPFVSINCGGIPETIIESELFGHEAGSFTGAQHRRIGKFEYASGGTVFLDEIESMPLHLQVKLLHVLQDRVIERIGSNTPIYVDVRIIAASKTDLKEASDKNEFRKDLYYRLNVMPILIPPLRNRKEDIPIIFQHYVLQASTRSQLPPPPIDNSLMQKLMARPWEGNVRELKNEAEKYLIGMNLPEFNMDSLPTHSDSSEGSQITFKDQVAQFEKNLIEQELMLHKGDVKKTQESLSIPKQTLYDKMKAYGIDRKSFK